MMMMMMMMMMILQVRAVEDIRIGDEVTTRYGGLNIGQVVHFVLSTWFNFVVILFYYIYLLFL